MELPIEDIVKVGASGGAGIGFITAFTRFIRGDMKRIEVAQSKTNNDIYSKLAELTTLLARQELDAARTYVRQDEFTALRNHIDAQFVDQRNFLVSLFRDQK